MWEKNGRKPARVQLPVLTDAAKISAHQLTGSVGFSPKIIRRMFRFKKALRKKFTTRSDDSFVSFTLANNTVVFPPWI
jgi:hypothetical protein